MQIPSRFTIALHILSCMDVFKEDKITSDYLANSIGVNPVIIRRILGQLKDAQIVEVKRGVGGAQFARPMEEMTFLDVYQAVEAVHQTSLFHFHEHPNPSCPVGANIHHFLDARLAQVQHAMEEELASIPLTDLREEANKYLS